MRASSLSAQGCVCASNPLVDDTRKIRIGENMSCASGVFGWKFDPPCTETIAVPKSGSGLHPDGPPRQITRFPDEIVAYAWSPDGKQLALTRFTQSRDVVLISNFH
jgi:hypothetical protein